jgi:hypothetical protein
MFRAKHPSRKRLVSASRSHRPVRHVPKHMSNVIISAEGVRPAIAQIHTLIYIGNCICLVSFKTSICGTLGFEISCYSHRAE